MVHSVVVRLSNINLDGPHSEAKALGASSKYDGGLEGIDEGGDLPGGGGVAGGGSAGSPRGLDGGRVVVEVVMVVVQGRRGHDPRRSIIGRDNE